MRSSWRSASSGERTVDHWSIITKIRDEYDCRGKQDRYVRYALLSTFAAHGGLEVDLLDGVTYRIDQYWQHALIATYLIVERVPNSPAMTSRRSLLRWPPIAAST